MSVRKEFREFRGECQDFRKKLKEAAKGGFTPEEVKMLRDELGEVIQEGAEVLGVSAELVRQIKEVLGSEL